MLFFLRKLVEAMALPFGFCGLLMVAAIVLRRRWIAMASLVLICALSTETAATSLLRPLEQAYPAMPVAQAPEADAIVVLAGNIIRQVSPAGVQWGNGANRFFTGVELAQAHKANLLVLSSGMTLRVGRLLRDQAIQDGIAPERIVVTPTVLTTQEEAGAISLLPGIHSILLVTSAFHMPRAVLLFRSRGFDVKPFPTDQRTVDDGTPPSIAYIPNAGSLSQTEMALQEYYGLAVYRTFPFLRGSPPRFPTALAPRSAR